MDSDEELRVGVYFLHRYHRYWLRPGQVNPDVNRITKFILNLKNPEHRHHTEAVQYFGRNLIQNMDTYLADDEIAYAAIVPSSTKGKISEGLVGVIRHAQARYSNLRFPKNPLVRHKSIPKLATGGVRAKQVHLNSICVEPQTVKRGAKILLLDDVVTTKNSLEACRELLYAAGARLVVCVALAKTVED